VKSSLFPVQDLKRRTLSWANRLRVNPKVVHVQDMRRKRGSCSSAGTVSLASDLAVQDQRFQHYVIVHELLHLRLSTLGRVFKALMSAHVPGWQAIQQPAPRGKLDAPKRDSGTGATPGIDWTLPNAKGPG
jgi:predicted metal-dependent hydrolase